MNIHWYNENEEKLKINQKHGVTYLTYPALEALPGCVHGFSTRLGGVSEGCFAQMNLSFTRGDREEAVRENYRLLGEAMGFSPEDVVTSDQTHTTHVLAVGEKDRGNGITRPRPYQDVDGLVTNVPGLMLATFYADCVPLFFVDPKNQAVGLSHSGWRGTAGRMGQATVRKMTEEYGSDPKELYAAIGPSICQDCYEVSEDVILEFQKTFPKEQWDALFYQKPNGRFQLNLWEANRQILLDAGIPFAQISMPNLCTCCNPDFLFSHRASQGKRGNLGAFLGIRKLPER